MRIDKTKLGHIFALKLFDIFRDAKSWGAKESKTWHDYLKGAGCRLVYTPNGMLPTRSQKVVHLKDPGSVDWRIQMDRDTALKILALGLP